MHPFTLTHATDSAAAIAAASEPDARFIAGGTNIIDLMKLYVEQPRKLVNITSLDLKDITVLPGGGVRIGALVPNSDLAYHPYIRKQYPVLSEALLSGASAQLRNMATTAGNVMQRTRCPYFYDTAAPCNKRAPGTGCSAIPGYNRPHAVLGGSTHCIATHPSDMCVAMAALDAIIHVAGANDSRREIPFTSFHLLPGDTPHIETVLKQGELIIAVELPAIAYASRSHYHKARDRSSYEFALASAAVVLDISGNTIREARIALGGVGTKPWRATEAELALKGAPLSLQSFQAAAEAALAGAKTQRYNSFKPALAKQTLIHALETTGGLS
jgi:xanthine dehydrogenase YagS FAD-binding subunit